MEGGSAPPVEPAHSIDKFEEYRLLIQSTEKLTDRRQLSAQVWVTLHTLLFAALGFLSKEIGASILSATPEAAQVAADGKWLFVISISPLVVLGIFSCAIWRKMLASYRSLIAWRFDQLMEIERSPELEGLHRVLNREYEHFFGPNALEKIGFTDLERRLPAVLIIVYAGFFIVAVLVGLGMIS
jgi:hypothetical protein